MHFLFFALLFVIRWGRFIGCSAFDSWLAR